MDMVDGMTPLDVVVRILNNQLSTLMWIDEKVSWKKFWSNYIFWVLDVVFQVRISSNAFFLP